MPRPPTPLVRLAVLPAALLVLSAIAGAREINVPVRFDNELIRHYLLLRAYTDVGTTARVWDDGSGCNYLVLSNPKVHAQGGLVRVRSQGKALVGTLVADRCLPLLEWSGFVEVLEEPVLSPHPGVVEFRVVDSKLYGLDGEAPGVAGTLWEWMKSYVHPRLERLRLDLNPAFAEVRSLLPVLFPGDEARAQDILDSVALAGVEADQGRVTLAVRLDVPEEIVAAPAPLKAEPALTAEELQRWTDTVYTWDAFLTLLIKRASADASPALRTALLEVLLNTRRDILGVLISPPAAGADPLRALFMESWSQLGPILRAESNSLPATSALHWLSFITATDALRGIDELAPNLGFTLSADALRRLARIALPDLPADALEYSMDVDPDLRRALGFGEPIAPPRGTLGVHLSSFFLIGAAQAADTYDELVTELTGWLPTLNTLDEYLPMVGELLDYVAEGVLNEGELASRYHELFRPLVLATAWQESCWRQFVGRSGKFVPIRSGTGSIGIMQVNQHVWRGFYDINGLHWDIGYNARAGAEILHHYLVDYAIAKDEHIKTGDIQNLARATYAMYNGGPSQMPRYRNNDAPDSLQAIDRAFWEKYQAIKLQAADTLAVAQCWPK